MAYIYLLLLCTCILSIASAHDLVGKIQWNDECPGLSALRSSKFVLDNGRLKGSVTHDGSFRIPDVPVGTYILSVVSPNYAFDQVRVDVLDSQSTPEVRPYVLGTPLNPPSTVLLSHPIILTPRQKHAYFIPPESFDLVAMFSNPMMLIMVVGGVMMLAMPYLMKNMDPEAMEEFKEQHAKVSGFQSAMASGDLKSGLSAFLGNAEDETSSVVQPPAAQKPLPAIKNRGNKNKRR
ncbi:ER membrane protein complex subunit 7 [Hypsizygus marmoreus]|uniref:ER membrane protein complex subunit 7 n=1 Tax=Hypsizygus marmoreus TaxID=39966 RepID=A0A369K7U2_HYPMA|nr:ER membrane protein complex subunit 7 [Hypsizygus marmoreus]